MAQSGAPCIKAGSFLLKDAARQAKWDSFASLDRFLSGLKLTKHTRGKGNSFFFLALSQLTQEALGKMPISWQFIFPICETRIHSVIREKCSEVESKSYYCNFFVFSHREHCSAFSVFIFSALIFITGENPHNLKSLLETIDGKEPQHDTQGNECFC